MSYERFRQEELVYDMKVLNTPSGCGWNAGCALLFWGFILLGFILMVLQNILG